MLLKDRNAVIYGGGGSIGGAVARAFAREGANVLRDRQTHTQKTKNSLKPHPKRQWVIPPRKSAAFVWRMEQILDL